MEYVICSVLSTYQFGMLLHLYTASRVSVSRPVIGLVYDVRVEFLVCFYKVSRILS